MLSHLGKHLQVAGERRAKAREDPKRAACSRGRELVRRKSPPSIRHRVNDVMSSSKEAQDYSHNGGMSGIEQLWRYVSASLPNNALSAINFHPYTSKSGWKPKAHMYLIVCAWLLEPSF